MGAECCSEYDKNLIVKEDYELGYHWPEDQFISNKVNTKTQCYKHHQEDKFYSGEWGDQNSSQKIIFYIPQKIFYSGYFQKGKPNGHGRVQFIDRKCTYQGEICEGKAQGVGNYEDSQNKIKFHGNYKNSIPCEGTLVLIDNDICENIYFQDYENLKAIINYKNGRRYNGKVHPTKFIPHGYGRCTNPDQSSYDGDWVQGKMHGKGSYKWQNGQCYEGQYNFNKKSGFGRMNFNSGNIYIGEWSDGKQNGKGRLYRKNKPYIQGQWSGNKLIESLQDEQMKNYLEQFQSVVLVNDSI